MTRFGFVAILLLCGCITTEKYQVQVTRADAAEKQAKDEQSQIDELKTGIASQKDKIDGQRSRIQMDKAAQDDLQAKLKAAQDQITTLQKSNKELTASLEAKKPELARKVAALIKERDDLQEQLRVAKQASPAASAPATAVSNTTTPSN